MNRKYLEPNQRFRVDSGPLRFELGEAATLDTAMVDWDSVAVAYLQKDKTRTDEVCLKIGYYIGLDNTLDSSDSSIQVQPVYHEPSMRRLYYIIEV